MNALQANPDAPRVEESLSLQLLEVSIDAANAAAQIIRESAPRLSSLVWVEKGTADFVTDVDNAAEARIAEVILRRFPDATILGEELSPAVSLQQGGLTFIADPLDGTTNFLHGYPHYAISIGAFQDAEAVAAVVLNVPRGDLFSARKGDGCRLNGQRAKVSTETRPLRSLIGTGFPFKRHELLEQYARQFVEVSRQTAGIRRAGSAALDLADVACGRFDGFWELDLAPWDIAAGTLLVREAGGVVTDLSGAPLSPSYNAVVAGNPDIHRWLLHTLQSAAADDSPPT